MTHSPARDAAYAALRAQAQRTACRVLKGRARDYLREPKQLDFLGWHTGFFAQGSLMTPCQLIAFAKEILRLEGAVPRFELVPIKLINAKAAIVVGRYQRHGENGLMNWKANSFKARQLARRAAA
jgi:hypothetical protein